MVQIVAGLYPDMPERDPRGANEAVNPDYFDRADLRIRFLVDKRYCAMHRGLLGYYLPILGLEKTKRHWRYLVARWEIPGELREIGNLRHL